MTSGRLPVWLWLLVSLAFLAMSIIAIRRRRRVQTGTPVDRLLGTCRQSPVLGRLHVLPRLLQVGSRRFCSCSRFLPRRRISAMDERSCIEPPGDQSALADRRRRVSRDGDAKASNQTMQRTAGSFDSSLSWKSTLNRLSRAFSPAVADLILVRRPPAPTSIVICVISRTRMKAKGKMASAWPRQRRWESPNGTELLRHRRLVGAGRRLTCVGAEIPAPPGLPPLSFRQSGFARLSITRGFGSTPFR